MTNKRELRFSGTNGLRPIWLSDETWLGWLIILGSIPIGVVGLYFKETIEGQGNKKSLDNCDNDDRRCFLIGFG